MLSMSCRKIDHNHATNGKTWHISHRHDTLALYEKTHSNMKLTPFVLCQQWHLMVDTRATCHSRAREEFKVKRAFVITFYYQIIS